MMMPNRTYSAQTGYRYGFNGKENDNEVRGDGNELDYGMRVYDTRLGRFLSVDPITKKYPDLSPFQFASNRPIDGIDYDGMEFVKYDKSYKSTIVIQKDRDPIMEAQYKYAMQAKMNVLVAGTLKEANQYMEEKGRKYDALLFAGHGNTVTSSISLEGRGYDAGSIDAYKQDIKNLGGYVKKDGAIILLGCFQSTPQYEEKDVPSVGGETVDIKIDGENLVKKFSATTNRKIVANRAATKISYDMFAGTVPQSLNLKQDPTHSYANMNNKYAGQWTVTTPDGKHTVIGTITFNPDGSYKTTPNHSNNNNSNGSTKNSTHEQKKPVLPPPNGG